MAVPSEITCKNLTGKFSLNKSLSDDPDKFFSLQGLSWLTRKAIGLATVVLTIKEYEQDNVYHIDITSVASGLSTTQENRTLDWTDRDHSDRIFGRVRGKSRLFKHDEFDRATQGTEDETKFLLAERLKDGKPSSFLDNEHLQSVVINQDAGHQWTVEQIWGFEQVAGERRYTRRLLCKKGNVTELMRLVYDYQGMVNQVQDDDDGLAYGN